MTPLRRARGIEQTGLRNEDKRPLRVSVAPHLMFGARDLLERATDVDGARTTAAVRRPRDRRVERPVDLERPGAVAERLQPSSISSRKPIPGDPRELPRRHVAHDDSGVAGLLLSVEPELGADQVIEAMRLGVDDLGPEGWDEEFGFGRINAMGALMAPVEGLVEAVGEITSPKQEMQVYLPTLSSN